MIDGPILVAAALVFVLIGLVAASCALLRTVEHARDDSADWLGVGSDHFPHARSLPDEL